MAKMTLMDLLPAILGFAGGAASPKFGAAAGQTLEMADAFKQRRRSQTLEEERMDMARGSEKRAEAGEQREAASAGRAVQNFQWSQHRMILADQEKADLDADEARLKNAAGADWGPLEEESKRRGVTIPETMKTSFFGAKTFADSRAAEGDIKQYFADNTIMDENVVKANLQPGESTTIVVRGPNGVPMKKNIYKPIKGESGGGTDTTGVTAMVNSLQGVQKANLTLEQAVNEGATAGAAPPKNDPLNPRQFPTDGGSFSAHTPIAGAAEKVGNIDEGLMGKDQALQDVITRAATDKNAFLQVVQMVANKMLPPELLTSIMAQKQGGGQAPVSSAAQPGSTGVAYSSQFE
jgi:hypothetical protein